MPLLTETAEESHDNIHAHDHLFGEQMKKVTKQSKGQVLPPRQLTSLCQLQSTGWQENLEAIQIVSTTIECEMAVLETAVETIIV